MSAPFQLKQTLGWVAALLLLLYACGQSDKKSSANTQERDSTAILPSGAQRSTAEISWQQLMHNPGFSRWQQRMEKNHPHFSPEHFQKTEERPISGRHAEKMTEEEWQVFQPYFIWSPDSSRAIDLYSYGSLPSASGAPTEGGGPDSKVSLVDISSQTKTDLLFAGPGTSFQHAQWINDSLVVVTGESDANARNTQEPVAWKINLHTRAVVQYDYPDTLAATR